MPVNHRRQKKITRALNVKNEQGHLLKCKAFDKLTTSSYNEKCADIFELSINFIVLVNTFNICV